MKEITVFELKEKINNKEEFLLLDVREPYEYEAANLNGKLIPLGELANHIAELNEWKNKEIIVHCRSGARSATAANFLLQQGFSNVSNLAGGIKAWKEHIDPKLEVV